MKLWRQLGYAHMNEYLERELGYSPQVGIERLRVAHALAELPQIEASLGAGDLAFSAVRELTRVATAETDQEWLDKVRGKNLREIEGMVSGKKRGARPEDPSNPHLTMRVVRLELAPAVFARSEALRQTLWSLHGASTPVQDTRAASRRRKIAIPRSVGKIRLPANRHRSGAR